uniref:Orf239 n=1 Tax=Eruca vesicaria subsp. sativa TaxID=29727 RepID=A0A088BEY2_ERUVS|nr:orf239 [Eruca vesicaria subsp. sativa]
MYLLIVFLPLLGSSVAGFFERFLGSEGSAILTTTCVSFFALVSFSFCLSHFRLKGPLRGILNLFLVFFITIVISLIRIKVMHLLGGQALPLLLEPIIWAAVTGSSRGGSESPKPRPLLSGFTYTSDMLEDSDSSGRSSSVNRRSLEAPQTEEGEPSVNQLPPQEAGPSVPYQDQGLPTDRNGNPMDLNARPSLSSLYNEIESSDSLRARNLQFGGRIWSESMKWNGTSRTRGIPTVVGK